MPKPEPAVELPEPEPSSVRQRVECRDAAGVQAALSTESTSQRRRFNRGERKLGDAGGTREGERQSSAGRASPQGPSRRRSGSGESAAPNEERKGPHSLGKMAAQSAKLLALAEGRI